MQELDSPTAADVPATLTSFNPATGEALGTVPLMGPEKVAAAVASARQAFPGWRDAGFNTRKLHLLAWRDALMDGRDALARLYTQENGKPLAEAMASVLNCVEFLEYYAKKAEGFLKDAPIYGGNILLRNQETVVVYEPKGVVAVISPWNFPLLLAMAEISAALAAGNTVVLKPSELTPLVGQALARLAEQAGLPPGVFAVVTGDGTTGAALTNARVDRICFTGSVATGTKVGHAAMSHLVPVTLELGGKDPALVLADANIELTSRGLVWAAFTNAGQVCASAERAYIHKDIAERLLPALVERTRALVVGNGLEPATEVGPLISETQLARVEAQVQDAVAKGAKLLVGGKRRAGPGHFFEPTILTDVTPDMLIMQEETFGPLLPLILVDSEAEMLALANDSPYGLSATIWTSDLRNGKVLARKIEAGSVWVNTGLSSYGSPLAPRGGFKASGIGKIGGPQGLMEMVNTKLIEISTPTGPKIWWYPTWPGAYDFMSSGIDVLHGRTLGERWRGLVAFLKNRR